MKAAKSASLAKHIYGASLSKRELALLAGWERGRRISLSLSDISRAVGAEAARDVARRLVRKGALARIARGIYLVRPVRTMLRPTAPSAVLQAAVLLQGERYYLGGLWALTFHRLTEQQFVSTLDVFTNKWKQGRRLGSAKMVFHRALTSRLSYGVVTSEIEGMRVQISDPERTLLDLLDVPSLAGDARTSLNLVTQALAQTDSAKLVEYAMRGSRHSTCQRLGVLLERQDIPPRRLARLRAKTRETKSMLSMLPGVPRTGTFNRRWRVIENDQ